MPNQNIFCNSPWYELQIYWDGSFGICCQEAHKLYALDQRQYNIALMTIAEWFNSDPVKRFRSRMLGDQTLTECKRCGHDELFGGNSRRLKCNQKSVIFTRSAFEESYNQSPGFKHFQHSLENNGQTLTMPIDMHIDLGNYCNLACKMCKASASSTFALQEVKWGIKSSQQYIGTDWTRHPRVWEEFKKQLLEIPKLNNIHFMGGETLLTDKFEDLVNTFVAHKKFDVCFSFVTNGTTFNAKLLDKLKKFRRVGVEVSIETLDEHNAYQRQGTDTAQVLENIQRYKQYCNGSSITLSLRPAPSILSLGYIVPLLEYALDNQFIVKYNLCYSPTFMNAIYLPQNIKQMYKEKFLPLLDRLSAINVDSDYNASNLNNCPIVIKEITNVFVGLLESETPCDNELQLEALVRHCERWDRVYGYDARALYPEWQEFLTKYNYDPTPSSVINFS